MKKAFIIFFIFLPLFIYNQTYTVHHPIPWALNHQYMWGPQGSSWNLNLNQVLDI